MILNGRSQRGEKVPLAHKQFCHVWRLSELLHLISLNYYERAFNLLISHTFTPVWLSTNNVATMMMPREASFIEELANIVMEKFR